MGNLKETESWDLVIKPSKKLIAIDFKELWRYRDLIMLFVRRDLVAVYKQTILGPLWHIIQPLLTTITFTVVFGKIAQLSTAGVPGILFYMSGIVLWQYFGTSLDKTSNAFIANSHILTKVYFPRLVIPISIVISNLISLGIQFLFFTCFLLGYMLFTDFSPDVNWTIVLIPYLIILMAFLGLGFGIIVSALTTKYRDLTYLVRFGVQLMMYGSSVIFPLSSVSGDLKYLILANPMTAIIETFRHATLGAGEFEWAYLAYSTVFAIVIFIIGLMLFGRVEKSFADTI